MVFLCYADLKQNPVTLRVTLAGFLVVFTKRYFPGTKAEETWSTHLRGDKVLAVNSKATNG